MCGIAGVVVPPGAEVSEEALARMNAALARRGPDDEGYYLDRAGGCGLAHRRLSIIDLGGGRQPLGNGDGRVQVVVNGEIYNFLELRAELEGRGCRFRTRSDSEVVAHGYEVWGEGVVSRLEGMFALAVWDAGERRLLLARDRMGKKPLYYAFAGETLAFASELKALIRHPEAPRDVSLPALALYLTYECVPEDRAILEGAKKLLPATYLVHDREARRTEIHEYWSMRFRDSPDAELVAGMDDRAIAAELRTRIREATRARLVSDVPLGVLLSGGIDSSTVAAAMAEIVPRDRIKTFSVSFEDPSFDESSHARLVAAHLGTEHHEERLSPEVMLEILPEVADFMCEPLGDASVIPTYLLSCFTRRSVTVALGGDGGDELFLGYPTFQAEAVARAMDAVLPLSVERAVGRAAGRLARSLPVSRKNFSLDFKLKRFAQGLGYASDLRHQAWLGSFLPEELSRVLAEDVRAEALAEDPYRLISGFRTKGGLRDHKDRAVQQYARLYLAGDVLVKVDRASMARGLEVRAPLLDRRVVELANAIPGALKLRGLTTKHILKEAVRPWLPRRIIDRPKKGFGIPIASWIRGPLKELAFDLLSREKIRREGFFDPTEVARLLDEHVKGRADHRKPLWTLIAFEMWLERYGPGSGQRALAQEGAAAAGGGAPSARAAIA